MKQKEYDRLIDLTFVGGGFIAGNDNARELIENCHKGEVITFKEITARDLRFHRCYMSLLSFIYAYLPKKFQNIVPEEKFYLWLKHLQGKYKVIFEFKDGTKLVEYESIAFGNMPQKRFEEYVKEQLPFIYENVIGAFFEGDIYNNIIETIEEQYKKFLERL